MSKGHKRNEGWSTPDQVPPAQSLATVVRRIQRMRLGGLLMACSLFMVATGCGDGRPQRVAVSGQVLVDGEPVPAGSIRFVPEGSRPAIADLDQEGRFTLRSYDGEDGAVVGTHRVQVAARAVTGDEKIRWYAPQKYSDFRSSGLTVEVTEPVDDLVIDLTWGGKKPRGK